MYSTIFYQCLANQLKLRHRCDFLSGIWLGIALLNILECFYCVHGQLVYYYYCCFIRLLFSNLYRTILFFKIEDLETRVRAQQQTLSLNDAWKADLEMRLAAQEMARHDGSILWKISGFESKKKDAISGQTTSLYSPAFYSGHVRNLSHKCYDTFHLWFYGIFI